MKRWHWILILFGLFVGLGLGARQLLAVEPITSCEPSGVARPLCGWQNPEDMAALPNGRYVLVSEYGGQNGEKPGTLSLLDLETEQRKVLYTGGAETATELWGDPTCTQRPAGHFSPHGIHLSQRLDGQLQLLAVQHHGRESVEMFAVTPTADSWSLSWRGCVIPPEGSMLNDVVATPDGGFLATHMLPKGSTAHMFVAYLRSSLLGAEESYVLAWQPVAGFRQLAGSRGQVANGIEIAPDGVTIFVNYSAAGEVRRINRLTGVVEGRTSAVPPVDNASWGRDGRLLVSAATGSVLDGMGCTNLAVGTCPVAYAILALDPVTLQSEVIYEGGPGTPGGGGTVALQLSDGGLLIGTFAGDRIVRVAPEAVGGE